MSSLQIRSANLSESNQILNWRNHPKVLRGAISAQVINEDIHTAWFTNMVKSDNIFIVEQNGIPIGVVYFERPGLDEFEDATWSFYVVPEQQGKCLGRTVMTLGLQMAHDRKILNVYADVLHENTASLQLHDELGFVPYMANDRTVKFYKEIY